MHRSLLVLVSLFLAFSAKAQTDTSIAPATEGSTLPAATAKPPKFHTIQATYIATFLPRGNGFAVDFEVPGPVSKHRLRFGLERRMNAREYNYIDLEFEEPPTTHFVSSMAYFDYVWYGRSPHVQRFLNTYFESGIALGVAGFDVQYFGIELRSAYGLRLDVTNRVGIKCALKARLGIPNVAQLDFGRTSPYPEISLDLGIGYDLF